MLPFLTSLPSKIEWKLQFVKILIDSSAWCAGDDDVSVERIASIGGNGGENVTAKLIAATQSLFPSLSLEEENLVIRMFSRLSWQKVDSLFSR